MFVTIVHLYSVIFKGVTLVEGAQHSYLSSIKIKLQAGITRDKGKMV